MGYQDTKITPTYEALVVGLFLSVTAPTDEKARLALQIAEELAAQLTPKQVAKAKKEAEVILAFDHKWNNGSLHALRAGKN